MRLRQVNRSKLRYRLHEIMSQKLTVTEIERVFLRILKELKWSERKLDRVINYEKLDSALYKDISGIDLVKIAMILEVEPYELYNVSFTVESYKYEGSTDEKMKKRGIKFIN
jgi:hypothetical protein